MVLLWVLILYFVNNYIDLPEGLDEILDFIKMGVASTIAEGSDTRLLLVDFSSRYRETDWMKEWMHVCDEK